MDEEAEWRAQELGRDGIRVNSISPGMVRTGMTAKVYADPRVAAERDALVPLGRVATPEDIADVVAFLLGQDSRYINGHDLVVDGGISAGRFRCATRMGASPNGSAPAPTSTIRGGRARRCGRPRSWMPSGGWRVHYTDLTGAD